MHEVSIMQSTLEIAIAKAEQNKATTIDRLTMNIGDLSGVVPEALEFAFEVLTKETIAENAQLEINSIAVVCHCPKCDRDFQPEAYIYQCPDCGQISSDVISGRELELDSLVIS